MSFARFAAASLRGAALGFICLAAAVVAQPALAQRASMSSEMTALYGRGVHSYFAGQSHEAEDQFSQVILAGASDPRVYYFRAMARLRSGHRYDAESDMRTGAAYEAQDPGVASEVGQALARIQGPDRQLLEKYRRQARIDRVQRVQMQSRDLYEQRQSREADVLRRPKPIAVAGPTRGDTLHLQNEWAEALEGFLRQSPPAKWINKPASNAT